MGENQHYGRGEMKKGRGEGKAVLRERYCWGDVKGKGKGAGLVTRRPKKEGMGGEAVLKARRGDKERKEE